MSDNKYYKYKTLNDLLKQNTPGVDPLSLLNSDFLKDLKLDIPSKPNKSIDNDRK